MRVIALVLACLACASHSRRTRFNPSAGDARPGVPAGYVGAGAGPQLSAKVTEHHTAHRHSHVQLMAVELEEAGEFGTTDYCMTFKSDGKVISPWHNAPLELEGGLYNMLTEIPRMTLKKMEVDTKAEGNPIKQDEKKGKARLYHGPIFWNYGCLPQTWEDPNVKGDDDVGGAFGDNDPVDVVEIGAASLAMGSFTPVKVLGCLSMIDDGELDWKVIAINAADEHASSINDIDDIEKYYPGTVSGIREWFRWYKTPDGKPVNSFGHGEEALGAAETKKVIEETHHHYKKLLAGETDAGKLWLPEELSDATGTSDLHHLLLSRRTVNNFCAELPMNWESALQRAVEAATYAPNHKMTEPWRFHLLGPEAVRRVCELNAEIVASKKGPQAGEKKLKRWLAMPGWLVVSCVQRNAEDAGSMDDPNGVAREDYAACCCAVQNLCLSLHADGIGTKWTSGAVNFHPNFSKAVGLPPDQYVVGTIWFGKAEGQPSSPSRKLSVEDVLCRHD